MTKFDPTKPVTIQDVARHANVSTATVSRTLSAPNSVSEKKRVAVQKAVRATGYRANRAARNLRTQRSNAVLALLPTLGNPFFSQVLQGIADVLTPAGQTLIVAETGQLLRDGETLLTYFDDKRADGVIVLDGAIPDTYLKDLQSTAHRRNVVFACEWSKDDGFVSVRSANADGARQVVEHLTHMGHRKIAHVQGPEGNVLTEARCDGYVAACRAAGIRPQILQGDFSLQAGVSAGAALLHASDLPTAVFCASDDIAFGLISHLSREGLSVPRDISVVGFDDIEYSAHFVPPLTTVRQDRVALGRAAAHALLSASSGTSATHTEIPVSLVTRASTSVAD